MAGGEGLRGKVTLGNGSTGEGRLLQGLNDNAFWRLADSIAGGGGSALTWAEMKKQMADYIKSSAEQIVYGNFTDKVTALGTAGQIASGILNLDAPGDIRDFTYDIKHWKWDIGHITQTFLDGVGFVPVIGVVKYAGNVFQVFRKADGSIHAARSAVRSEQEATRAAVQLTDIHIKKFADIESMIAHAAEKHIGKTDDYLKGRLLSGEVRDAASTFKYYETAKGIIMPAIRNNTTKFDEWAKNWKEGQKNTYDIFVSVNSDVGTIMTPVRNAKDTIVSFNKVEPNRAVVRVKYVGNGSWTFHDSFLKQ